MAKKLIFKAEKTDEGFKVFGAIAMKRDCDGLPNGRYKVVVEKEYNKASELQFGYLYGVVYPIALKAYVETGSEDITTIDQLDIYFKQKFAGVEIVDRETGEITKLPPSKAEFKTVDEMVYQDKIIAWCNEWLGTDIPPPDKNYKNK